MAAEIDAVGAGGCLRNMKTIAIRRERVGGGECQREIAAGFEFGAGHLESLQWCEVALNQGVCFFPVEIFDARDGIAQFREQAILNDSARECYGIWDAMKGDHRIFWHEV